MPAATTNEQGVPVTERLWLGCSREWTLALQSPFVIALASGNLELDTFHDFVSQDLHFFKCFAQVLEMAKEYAGDDTKASINLLIEDFKDHVSSIKKMGDEWTKEYPVNPATVECTGFISAVSASGRVVAYILGAMLPHLKLYDFICQRLKSLLRASGNSHHYKKWIDCYSSDCFSTNNFQDSTARAELLLNKLSIPLTGAEDDNVQKNYEYGMKLELHFFSSQPMVQKTVVPLLKEYNPSEYHFEIYFDFDLTCTASSSSAILAEIAIEKASESDKVQSENRIGQRLRSTWELLSKEYKEYEQCIANMIDEYDRCTKNILLVDKGKKIVGTNENEPFICSGKEEKFNFTAVQKALEPILKSKKRAVVRVLESVFFKGLNLEDIRRAGERFILQDGCMSFFQSVTEDEMIGADIHVLSYCWCNDLLKSVFSSGEIISESPFNKADCSGNVLKKSENLKKSDKRKKLIVYIGDSVDDLLCLLEADIGIVINASENLKKVASRFDIALVPLFKALVEKQKEMVGGKSCSWKGQSGTLYTVSSWDEIHSFILGPSFVHNEMRDLFLVGYIRVYIGHFV